MSESLRDAGRAGATRPRLVTRPLMLVFAVTVTSLAGVFLLLSVVPMYAVDAGAGRAGAGLATGALMLTTVLAELALPRLLTRFGYRTVLAAGTLLLTLPPLALALSSGTAVIIGASLVRGFGFGVAVVLPNALVAALAPEGRRGEALGLFGITSGAPAVLALPLGVWLADRVGYPPVFIASAVLALAALAVLPGIPNRLPSPPAAPSPSAGPSVSAGPAASGDRPLGVVAGLRSPALLRPATAFAATAMAAGILITFLPEAVPAGGVAAAALFVQSAATTAARWWAGRTGDRHGAARLLMPALAVAGTGIALLVLVPHPAAVFGAMVLFGAGFGVTQNASLTMMYERAPASAYGTVSALWNTGYDGGMGVGGAAFGVAAAHSGFPAAFGLAAAVILLALPLARRS